MSDIDIKKILDQDPEFKKFATDAVLEAFLLLNKEILTAMYSFYSIGMTSKQVAQWIRTNQHLNERDNK